MILLNVYNGNREKTIYKVNGVNPVLDSTYNIRTRLNKLETQIWFLDYCQLLIFLTRLTNKLASKSSEYFLLDKSTEFNQYYQ